MKRLYYLAESMQSTQAISDDLHQAGITDWNFHVLSRSNESGLYRRHIHSANITHKSDLIHSAERGIVFGFFTGILLAAFLALVPLYGTTIGGLAIFFILLLGVLLGGWVGGFVGIQKENYKIARFHDKLEQGYFLIMIDVSVGEQQLVHQLMQIRHPKAQFCTEGSSIITPFHHPAPLKTS